ncbi:hypothetical protein V2J09_010220 [Rumex salicifolius]
MEVDETQTQATKFSRVANGRINSSRIGPTAVASTTSSLLGAVEAVDGNLLRSWQHSSRIIRVSRASGGKDRHSKVWTAKGLRDRRVRLSVTTAIQFYDLQDRLGFDQPSKAVEWLIKAARDSIDELPSLNGAFPETPRQQSDERRPELGGGGGGGGNNADQAFDSSAELELDGDPGFTHTQQQHGSNLSRSSACSSNSETSKGSGGLSLSRNEIRVKARERARERTAKDKTEPNTTHQLTQNQQSSSSFTQLLTAGIGNMENAVVASSSMDNYFNATGLMGVSSSSRGTVPHQIVHPGIHQAMMTISPFNTVGGDGQNQNHQQFPFSITDQQFGASGSTTDHYNLNFSMSPSSSSGSLAVGFNNRGTLQSNSSQSPLMPQIQRYSSSQLDGTTMPFFLSTAVDNQHHQHAAASLFPPGLQLYYGDNGVDRLVVLCCVLFHGSLSLPLESVGGKGQVRPDPVLVEAHVPSQARTDTSTVSIQLGVDNDYEVDALILQELNQPSTQAPQTQAPTNMEPLRPATRRKLQPLRSKKNTTVVVGNIDRH